MAKVKALQKSRAQKECVGGSSLNWQDWASKCIVHCCINIEMVIAGEPWHVLAMVLFLEETASVAGIPCSVEPFQQGLRKTEWQSHGRGAPRCPAEELSEVCLRIPGFTVPVPSRNKHISCLAVSRDLHCLKETHGQHQELQQISQRPSGTRWLFLHNASSWNHISSQPKGTGVKNSCAMTKAKGECRQRVAGWNSNWLNLTHRMFSANLSQLC